MRKKPMLAVILGLLNIGTAHAAGDAPVVLELFTSQGCSSCPPADALLKKLSAENSQLLPLSFHVDYWNYLGWKDPYSSQANTDRQHGYASALDGQVYTPELVVNGTTGVVGSDEGRVRNVIEAAQRNNNAAHVAITTQSDGHAVSIAGTNSGVEADVWEVSFRPYVRNDVDRGENGGRTLDHVNSVTGLKHLGTWSGQTANYTIDMPVNPNDKTAILVQSPHYGRIIGASLVR